LTGWVIILCVATLALGFGAGCKSPKGNTKAEKRADVRSMRDSALVDLYKLEPQARGQVSKSVGYAVFDNLGMNLLLLATGRGHGVAVDRKNGKEIFMKMMEVGGGPGIGVKDFRQIIIFYDRPTFDRFLEYGVEVGGDADLALKSGEDGAGATVSESTASLQGKLDSYLITKAGAAIQAVASGTKYYKDKDLN
jgi:lipid-binding SYLF domain-containing protein